LMIQAKNKQEGFTKIWGNQPKSWL